MGSIAWKRASVSTLACAALLTSVAWAGSPAADAAPLESGDVTATTTGSDDATNGVAETEWGDDTSKQGKRASKRTGSWDASLDLGSAFSTTRSIGAQAAWALGVTGKDVTVAMVDTGTAPVAGLDDGARFLDGPDLSFESQEAGTRYRDGFGHGTHLAGLIAGADRGFDPKRPDPSLFAGVAPDAKLLNVKVGTGDGGADVSQVIAAIDWVVEHRDDAGMRIRVLNLAYGTASTQSWQVDPLARAVENAWRNGILVVSSAGNDGSDGSSLLMPAVDPHVLAVGAVDHRGTIATDDDTVADFSSVGNDERRADVLAPGKSVVSLRAPGSNADLQHPEGLVAGDDEGRYFRGSGTSQAAAIVAGEAALLFDAKPRLTPDEVKAVLMRTARPLGQADPAQGAGVTDVAAALALVRSKATPDVAPSALPASTGLGSLEASRGGEHVVDPGTGIALTGEIDALGSAWNGAAWVAAQHQGATWSKGLWNGRAWTGEKWKDKQVLGVRWTGDSWSGKPWADEGWSDDVWQARSWRGNSWKARSWREESWKARSWRSLS
ncbi:serine protease AprX [Nocardioides scoriae]|uniref:Serine protease AprX n=1 Tax=Nocardioides scoriae TaxID=642780 RepID=A0A1H1LKP0_9ACTN|nr:S8 family serine peptidase [Nocardioides scoriae]SDR74429.1 serine protease AprX [Nocardioides scoriae]